MNETLNIQVAQYVRPTVHIQIARSLNKGQMPEFSAESSRSYGAAFNVKDAALWEALSSAPRPLKSLAGTSRRYAQAILRRTDADTLSIELVQPVVFSVAHASRIKKVAKVVTTYVDEVNGIA